MKFDRGAMRNRFAELTSERDAKLAAAAPLREKRDKLVNKARAAEAAINAEIAEAEAGLFEIDQERADLVRALRGSTGSPAN